MGVDLLAAALCGLASAQLRAAVPAGWDATPLSLAFAGVAGACLFLGVPAAVLGGRGPRSLAGALGAVGLALGGAATAVWITAGVPWP